VVAALALLAGPGLTACSSPPPAPPRQPVGVETSVSTRYYPARGTTTTAIFAAIDANGLVDALNWARWWNVSIPQPRIQPATAPCTLPLPAAPAILRTASPI
jgi:hypothetical protein